MFLDNIRVAILGIGNCSSGLVQGINYYSENMESIGLIHRKIGKYEVSNIEIVAAFDIDKRKIGKDVSKAIFSKPNTAPKIVNIPKMGVTVQNGVILDSKETYDTETVEMSNVTNTDIPNVLKNCDVDVLINLISGSAIRASRFYAECALSAGCAFLNGTPSIIVSNEQWSKRFEDLNIPAVGDDLLDQIGATVVHIGLLEFLNDRGVHIDESYQLDVGGGAESLNTLWKTRSLKRDIKTSAVATATPYEFSLVSGSTDYVDFLENKRDSFFWIKGRYFNDAPFSMDIKLNTIDAPNAGAILVDVIRGLKIAKNKEVGGAIVPLCAYGFKKPPKRYDLKESYNLFKNFINS